MELGVFTRLVKRDSLEETFKQMKEYGLFHQQFNMSCLGLPSMPETYDQSIVDETLKLAEKYGIVLDGISGTFNMINPNKEELAKDIKNFDILCKYSKALGIKYINLCGGSKSPKGKFIWDDLNNTKEAWDDLVDTAKTITAIAKPYDLILCIEVETCIIVDTAEKALALIEEVGSDNLRVVMDNGNMLFDKHYGDNNEALKHGFDLIGKYVVLANAKDYTCIDGKDTYVSPGKGSMDFAYYINLLKEYGYDGPLMIHGLPEEDIPFTTEYLKSII